MNLNRVLEAGLEYFGMYYGSYRAQVIDNNDPEGNGRLMIHAPQVHGPSFPRVWAWPITAMAMTKGGIWAIPDIGEWVYVQFDHGRPEFPMWSGGWWGDGDTTADMTPSKVVVCTPEGLKVVLDRKAMEITVQQRPGNSIVINDEYCRVQHNGLVKVDASDVDILSEGTTNLRGQGVINIAAMDEVNILSTGSVKIDGADNVEVSATGQLFVGAADKVEVNSDTEVVVTSDKLVTLKAPSVAIEADELNITAKTSIEGDVDVNGNGHVNGAWYATLNSAKHTHPVVNGKAIQGEV